MKRFKRWLIFLISVVVTDLSMSFIGMESLGVEAMLLTVLSVAWATENISDDK